MEKLRAVYKYVSSINVAHVLVLALVVKSIVFDVSYASFLLAVPVLAYEAYKLYLKSLSPDPVRFDAELRKELDNIKAKINVSHLDQSIKTPTKRYF